MSQKLVTGLSAILIGSIMTYEGLRGFYVDSKRCYENYNSRNEIHLMRRLDLGEDFENKKKIQILIQEYDKLKPEFEKDFLLLISGLAFSYLGAGLAGFRSNLQNYS